MKSIRYRIKEIIGVLEKVVESTNNSLIKSKTYLLVSEIGTYEFPISMRVRCAVLQVRVVSKIMQGPNNNLETHGLSKLMVLVGL